MKEIIETREVTQKHYCRAESDRTFYNSSQMAGDVNRMISFLDFNVSKAYMLQ